MTSSQTIEAVTHYLAERFYCRTGVNIMLEDESLGLLRKQVERSLVNLLHLPRVTVSVPCITQDENGPLHLDDVLTNEDVERLRTFLTGV